MRLIYFAIFSTFLLQSAYAAPVEPRLRPAVSRWKQWVASRPAPCAREVDSALFLTPGATKTALVLHGYSQSPSSMLPTIRFFQRAGYNVIAPRLSGHFNHNIHDLQTVNYHQWLEDADEALDLALSFGTDRVTIAGYSLGGTLATYLALKHPESVDRLLLLSPAWRISTMGSIGANFGDLLGLSLNEFNHVKAACTLEDAFISGAGAHQVELLMYAIEQDAGYNITSYPGISVFSTLQVPTLILAGQNDEAVDTDAVVGLCAANSNHACKSVIVGGADHAEGKLFLQRRDGRPATHGEVLSSSVALDFIDP